MPLTDISVRHAKPRDKSYKMADMLGLYIQVLPSGAKLWKMKYRFDGREKKLSFGEYPRMSLREARRRRDDARDSISKGTDPAYEKKRERLRAKVLAEDTFTGIKNEYCNKRRRDGDNLLAPRQARQHLAQHSQRLEDRRQHAATLSMEVLREFVLTKTMRRILSFRPDGSERSHNSVNQCLGVGALQLRFEPLVQQCEAGFLHDQSLAILSNFLAFKFDRIGEEFPVHVVR